MQNSNLNYGGTGYCRNSRVESIFASIPDGLIVTDSSGIIEEFSLSAQTMFGYSREDAIGKNAQMLMPTSTSGNPEVRWKRLMALSAKRAKGSGRSICCRHSNGSLLHVHLSVAEFVENGQKYFTGIIHNVSERIEMENKMKAAMIKADQASHAKSEFLANMSHEVRTPLSAVTGMLELLQDTKLDVRQENFVDIAYTSANSLLNVISSILDFSKIESGNLSIYNAVFDLRQTVEQSVAVAASDAAEKGLKCFCYVAPEVPLKMLGDATQLGQILINLVANAVKFTDSGKIAIRVTLEAIKDARANIRIEVEDTGIGIAESELPVLFEPFTQVDSSSTRRHGGTGLGLTITKRLVELMRGKIGVTSKEGKGTTFWISLSFELTEEFKQFAVPHCDIKPQTSTSRKSNKMEHSRKRILIVDDIATNRRVCKEMLSKLGYDADLAIHGNEALDALKSQHYDLVLMDCQMPEMDGFDATRQIRALEQQSRSNSHLPVVALTAHVLEGDREASFDAGMDDYLTKPVLFAALESMLERWLPQ